MIKRKKPKVSAFKDINRKSIKEGDFLKALNYYGLEVNALDPQLLEVIFDNGQFYVENYYASKMLLAQFLENNIVTIVIVEAALI